MKALITKIRLIWAIVKGVKDMLTASQKIFVDMYVKLIIAKKRTVNDVQPANLQPFVLEILNFLGYDGNGEPLPVEETAA